MNLKSYLFYDASDDTETEVVCEGIDTALLLLSRTFDVLYIIEKVEDGTANDFGFPTVHISGYSTIDKD
ncbi:MAG: hypothetical protein E7612_06555 [Ruminococcaceae bacterium]|nr:hypothetical protein [Oscillospiraceae bacterium]